MKSSMRFNSIYSFMKYAKDYGHAKIKNAGFSDTEHHICTFLFFHDGVSQDTIAETLIMDKTTVAKALSSLESKGYIVRKENTDNRRKNRLSLTDEGRNSVADFTCIYEDWMTIVTEELSDEEKKIFYQVCEKIAHKAKQINEKLI